MDFMYSAKYKIYLSIISEIAFIISKLAILQVVISVGYASMH